MFRLASKNMDDKMAEMEESSTELRRVARHKMADMEENAAEIACEMSSKTHCMKSEMKRVKSEAYECLVREG